MRPVRNSPKGGIPYNAWAICNGDPLLALALVLDLLKTGVLHASRSGIRIAQPRKLAA